MVVSQAPGVLTQAGPAPLSCHKAPRGGLSRWARVQSAQASSLLGPLQGRTEPYVLTTTTTTSSHYTHTHTHNTVCPTWDSHAQRGEGARSCSSLSPIFLHTLAVLCACVCVGGGVLLRRPYVQIVPPQIHDFCLPKHLPNLSPEGEKPTSLSPFLSKGLLGAGGRQARVGNG